MPGEVVSNRHSLWRRHPPRGQGDPERELADEEGYLTCFAGPDAFRISNSVPDFVMSLVIVSGSSSSRFV